VVFFAPARSKSRARLLDARLHLLDRQLLDDDGTPVGFVDDLQLSGIEFGDVAAARDSRGWPRWVCVVLATRIFGGKPPQSRLHTIPWRLIAAIDTRYSCTPLIWDLMQCVEHRLRDHVIAHIPGGRYASLELVGVRVGGIR
jgi:hypothetical protein